MKSQISIFCCIFFFLLAVAFPTSAQDSFHITYQLENLSSNNDTLTGDLLLHVVNVSGEDVQDLIVWIPEPNKITYNNRAIYVGDLNDGQPKGILDHFSIPKELGNMEISEDTVVWKAEFTNHNAERVEIDVKQLPLLQD
jgi:hypothetical protein